MPPRQTPPVHVVPSGLFDPRQTLLLQPEAVRHSEVQSMHAAPLAPQQTGSWMVKYWATCPQDFSPRTWERLVNQDIEDFEIEWYADGLVFADGQTLR